MLEGGRVFLVPRVERGWGLGEALPLTQAPRASSQALKTHGEENDIPTICARENVELTMACPAWLEILGPKCMSPCV